MHTKVPKVPSGTTERFYRPYGTFSIWWPRFPALKRWAIIKVITRAYTDYVRPRCAEVARQP